MEFNTQIFSVTNEAILFIELDEDLMPKQFIDINSSACTLLGYSKEEFLRISPIDFFIGDEGTTYKKFLYEESIKTNISIRTRDGKCIPVKADMHLFSLNKNKIIFTVIRNLSEHNNKKGVSHFDNFEENPCYLNEDNEVTYQHIFNSFPDPVVITVNNAIVLANDEACRLIGADRTNIINKSIYRYFPLHYMRIVRKKLKYISANRNIKHVNEFKFNNTNSKTMSIQITSESIDYKGKNAIISVLRDITSARHTEDKITEIQRKTLQKTVPLPERISMETVYMPAKTVSGDFFRIHKISNSLVVGIIIDVCGNGVTSALSISAFDVLFHQEIMTSYEPMVILNNLNKKLANYLGEVYIAACCFSLDFNENIARIVGAGINQFIYRGRNSHVEERIVRGPFLGMFEESMFEEQILEFESGDKFYFLTDGLDFVYDKDRVVQRYMEKVTVSEFKNYINEFLNDTILELGSLEDDSTLLALEIK